MEWFWPVFQLHAVADEPWQQLPGATQPLWWTVEPRRVWCVSRRQRLRFDVRCGLYRNTAQVRDYMQQGPVDRQDARRPDSGLQSSTPTASCKDLPRRNSGGVWWVMDSSARRRLDRGLNLPVDLWQGLCRAPAWCNYDVHVRQRSRFLDSPRKPLRPSTAACNVFPGTAASHNWLPVPAQRLGWCVVRTSGCVFGWVQSGRDFETCLRQRLCHEM